MELIIVSIVEDIPEIREGMRYMVNQTPGFACISVYDNAESALSGLPTDAPDIVIMDIGLPTSTGVECMRKLKEAGYKMQFIMFTVYEDSDQVFNALAAGASGYLLKNTAPDKIIDALRELYAGGSPMSLSIARKVVASFHLPAERNKLSAREMEVLTLLSKGFLYKEIGAQLDISTGTVKQHIHHIYEKLHVQNRTEALNSVFGKRE